MILLTGGYWLSLLFCLHVGLRYLEAFFGMLICLMCIMFGWMVCAWTLPVDLPPFPLSRNWCFSFSQYIYAAPSQVSVLKGLVIPDCHHCGTGSTEMALGLVGAIIMPHNIYLHSGLVLVSHWLCIK